MGAPARGKSLGEKLKNGRNRGAERKWLAAKKPVTPGWGSERGKKSLDPGGVGKGDAQAPHQRRKEGRQKKANCKTGPKN